MAESKIQKRIIDRLRKKGWYDIKIVRCNKNGIADIIAMKPNLPPLFIEVKTPTGKLSKIQEFRTRELRNLGFHVLIMRK